jgi:Putative transposase/Transposase zinc-binding domain
VLEVADIVRLYGTAYREQYGKTLTGVQKRALRDIALCRTPFFGGHVYQCDHCEQKVFSYHSCRNRSCPKCHQDQSRRWLEQQQARLLPTAYFLLTFTLPKQLRPLARSHPRKIYGLLMKTAADALQILVRDPRYIGARIGALAVLHTWTRAMLFHPHVHMLVTAGGFSPDGACWVNSKNPRFLVPVRALSVIFRAKFAAALKKANLLTYAPASVWGTKWVVHSQHAGRGDKVLQYLARYVFRIAIANSRLESIEGGHVRFRYRDNRTQQIRRITLSGVEFLRRYLQHVLPKGVAKVRYYGIFSPSSKTLLEYARQLLPPRTPPPTNSYPPASPPEDRISPSISCPLCRRGSLILVQTLPARRSHPP